MPPLYSYCLVQKKPEPRETFNGFAVEAGVVNALFRQTPRFDYRVPHNGLQELWGNTVKEYKKAEKINKTTLLCPKKFGYLEQTEPEGSDFRTVDGLIELLTQP